MRDNITLQITERELKKIRAHGETTYPEECCGFLFGREDSEREIIEVVSIENLQDQNRSRRFLISPEQFLEAERYAKSHKLDLLGFYHSHPDHPAIPSEFDREHALPFYSYIIVSVREGKSAELRSWQLHLDRSNYEEECLNIGN